MGMVKKIPFPSIAQILILETSQDFICRFHTIKLEMVSLVWNGAGAYNPLCCFLAFGFSAFACFWASSVEFLSVFPLCRSLCTFEASLFFPDHLCQALVIGQCLTEMIRKKQRPAEGKNWQNLTKRSPEARKTKKTKARKQHNGL